MKFAKTRDVKSPTRGTSYSAGIDMYVPELSNHFLNKLFELNSECMYLDDTYNIVIKPHCHILIPSGIRFDFSTSLFFSENKDKQFGTTLALIAHNKSSIGIRQLDVAATVIDQDYSGETHLSITNTSEKDVTIEFGQKIVQFLLTTVLIEPYEEASADELFNQSSDRTGGFGSTGHL